MASISRYPDGRKETLIMAVQMIYIGPDQRVTLSPIGANGRVKEVLMGMWNSQGEGGVEHGADQHCGGHREQGSGR